MLSKPNVNDLMEKAGSRYEAALAIAKRARAISRKRVERGDLNIKDAVDIAAKEICDGKALVKIDGNYVVDSSAGEIDIDSVISETVEGILKDLNVNEEDTDTSKKTKKLKKSEEVEVTESEEEEVIEAAPKKTRKPRKSKKTENEND